MAHHYTINTQTTAGKRLQNEMRKRMRENIQRDRFNRENAYNAEDAESNEAEEKNMKEDGTSASSEESTENKD